MAFSERQRRLSAFGYFSFLIAWLFITYLMIVLTLFTANFFGEKHGDDVKFSDFMLWYQAGCMAVSEDSHKIYDADTILKWNQKVSGFDVPKPLPVPYPPWFFVIMAPLSLLPIRGAYAVWAFITIAATAFTLYYFLAGLGFEKKKRFLFILAVLVSQPFWYQIRTGQTSFITICGACLYFLGVLFENQKQAGFFLGLTALKLQHTAVFGLVSLLRGMWKAAAISVVVALSINLLAAIILGFDSIANYIGIVLSADAATTTSGREWGGGSEWNMENIRGFATRYLPDQSVRPVSWSFFAAGVGMIIFLIRKAGSEPDIEVRRLRMRWALALVVVINMIVSPHIHVYDHWILAIPAALTLPTLNLLEAVDRKKPAFTIWTALIILYPLVTWLCVGLSDAHIFDLSDSYLLMHTIILAAGLVVFLRRRQDFREYVTVPTEDQPVSGESS